MWQASRETWSWMGVSVNKKRACSHLPPLHQTGMAVRPMARPAATRENTTVEPSCRLTDGARVPRADSPATGQAHRTPAKWAEAEPANWSTASTVGTLPSVGIPYGIADARESHPFTGGWRSTAVTLPAVTTLTGRQTERTFEMCWPGGVQTRTVQWVRFCQLAGRVLAD